MAHLSSDHEGKTINYTITGIDEWLVTYAVICIKYHVITHHSEHVKLIALLIANSYVNNKILTQDIR